MEEGGDSISSLPTGNKKQMNLKLVITIMQEKLKFLIGKMEKLKQCFMI